MKNLIKKLCKKIEEQNKVRILFAVENGSRAWRLSSMDSDYDVRFVFVRPLKDYLLLNIKPDVINVAFNDEGKEIGVKGSFIDFSGFDVFKFCRLLLASNPTVIEWLITDIIYYGKQNKVFKELAVNKFGMASLYYHYRSLCEQNYLKYLKSKKEVTYKKYLYAMRGLINAVWVRTKNKVPPISFIETIEKVGYEIPLYIKERLKEIVTLKSKGKEKEIIQNIVRLDEFIEEFLKNKPEIAKTNRIDTKVLEKEIQKIVLKTQNQFYLK